MLSLGAQERSCLLYTLVVSIIGVSYTIWAVNNSALYHRSNGFSEFVKNEFPSDHFLRRDANWIGPASSEGGYRLSSSTIQSISRPSDSSEASSVKVDRFFNDPNSNTNTMQNVLPDSSSSQQARLNLPNNDRTATAAFGSSASSFSRESSSSSFTASTSGSSPDTGNDNSRSNFPLGMAQKGSSSSSSSFSSSSSSSSSSSTKLSVFLPIRLYRYTRFYQPRSTQPLSITAPTTKWKAGSNTLKKYITNMYLPFLMSHSASENPVVYMKVDEIGLGGQMLGFCDTLLLCLLTNRVFKFYTPTIKPHYYLFPLFNITYPVPLKKDTEREHVILNYAKQLRPRFVSSIHITESTPVPGVTASGDFNTLYKGPTSLSASAPFSSSLLSLPSFSQPIVKVLGATPKPTAQAWYASCLPSMFQPSSYLKRITAPLSGLLAKATSVGVHIRTQPSFADSAAKTHERGTGDVVTQQSVEKMLPRLRELMGDRGNLMFLAGDSEDFDSVMEREFPGRVLRVQKLELKNVGRDPSESALMRAVIELHLLSLCNHLVVTPNSRFSTVAVGLNTNCRSVDYFT